MENLGKIDAKEISKIASSLMPPFTRLGKHTEYDWVKLPWKGIYNKVLFMDRVTGATIELAKVEKGATFPEHYHPSVQTLFLVEGRLRSNDTIITPGTFNVIPTGQLHGPFFAEKTSIQYKYFSSVPVYFLKDGSTFIYKEDGTQINAGKLDMKDALTLDNLIRV
ncbi:cupin domain-containing protein [Mucilaginibacter paludis]|uniref:Cupin 2 conserved barrel domain protein n=1 Tax=Mucilaginibacter paludis DSM 18603 TaxID=714943 RepID=H1Y459_9SPHI|nr:cupin domain-containing protein [Mucilaginibacter paludis]EHQ24795.1 Cupin 2 conserved barrel domain protein [Mucilaginibacter paludis DSM 18603]